MLCSQGFRFSLHTVTVVREAAASPWLLCQRRSAADETDRASSRADDGSNDNICSILGMEQWPWHASIFIKKARANASTILLVHCDVRRGDPRLASSEPLGSPLRECCPLLVQLLLLDRLQRE